MSVALKLTRQVTECDCCGETQFETVAPRKPGQCQIVMCQSCGLLFANPSLDLDTIAAFYDEEFAGDPGSKSRQLDGKINPLKIHKDERRAQRWALPLLKGYFDPKGMRILDVRSRNGGLARALAQDGALVTAIDPLHANVDYMQERGGIEAIFTTVNDLTSLAPLRGREFDAVTMLTIHTLAHLPSPRTFLEAILSVLKPGGWVMLTEKDILEPTPDTGSSPFDSGEAHYVHFTRATLHRLLEKAGFEIIRCDIDPHRATAFKHLVAVARKPVTVTHPFNTRLPKSNIFWQRMRLSIANLQCRYYSAAKRIRNSFRQWRKKDRAKPA